MLTSAILTMKTEIRYFIHGKNWVCLLHINMINIFLKNNYFSKQKIVNRVTVLKCLQMFANLFNVWCNIRFSLLLLCLVCCVTAHHLASGKFCCRLVSEWKWKDKWHVGVIMKSVLTLKWSWGYLGVPDQTLRTAALNEEDCFSNDWFTSIKEIKAKYINLFVFSYTF